MDDLRLHAAIEELKEAREDIDKLKHVKGPPSENGQMCAIYRYSDEHEHNDYLYQIVTEPFGLRAMVWSMLEFGFDIYVPKHHVSMSVEGLIVETNDTWSSDDEKLDLNDLWLRKVYDRSIEILEDLREGGE